VLSGELFFGGFPGGVAFVPERLKPSSGAPAIVLTDFQLSGASVSIAAGSLLERAIAHTDSVTLAHKHSVFSVVFSALSYRNPETIRYRYKLDGLEQDWQEVGSERRQAVYTTLPAGAYTLRVQAAPSRGPWTDPGVSLQVTVLPAWGSSWWFRSASGCLFLLLIWWAYRLRVQQISRELTLRMEERLGERTRIAQHLHDTLLQGMLSASLQLDVAHRELPSEVTARPLVGRVVELMRQTIEEGRNAVRGLRTRHTNDLERAFAELRRELMADEQLEFRLILEGTTRELAPLIRDEIYSIGREALANAFRHSQATSVAIVINYAWSAFTLVVWDNGCGIDTEIARTGREGHWGLSGMRERAEKIGARLKVRSGAGAGTEVELVVPASVAFARKGEQRARRWFTKLWREAG
jgi:signal transduction histidine kinase